MTSRKRLLLGGVAALGVWMTARAAAAPQTARTEPHAFLRSQAGFSVADLAQLDRGEPIARVLPTDPRDVAIVGAVRIHAVQAGLFERHRNIANLKGSDVVLEIGRFGTPPSADDLRPLHFEDYDLETIRTCKPGDCGVRLSGANMERFAREVNWSAPEWRAQAAGLWRQLLAADAAAYMAHGTLGDYRNKPAPLEVAEEFNRIFDSLRYFESIAPDFFSYLRRYPAVTLPGTENILYWSKDDINRPVTRVTHLVLYPAAPGTSRPGLIATKQIYAAHYFDAGLGLTVAFDDGASGFYMLSVNRVRTRSLTGFMRGIVRTIVQRRSRDAMEGILRTMKAALERAQGSKP
jgi:hypothetical protein